MGILEKEAVAAHAWSGAWSECTIRFAQKSGLSMCYTRLLQPSATTKKMLIKIKGIGFSTKGKIAKNKMFIREK